MKHIENVKIKNWEVCCNDILQALISDDIDFNYNEDALQLQGKTKDIEFCPFCGKKLPLTFGDVEVT